MVEYAVLEEPVKTTGSFTSADTIISTGETFGVNKCILTICQIPYYYISVSEWHEYFKFDIQKGLCYTEKKKEIKKQSIQFAKNEFRNIDEFLIPKGCRKEDDNIAEACLLSLIKMEN